MKTDTEIRTDVYRALNDSELTRFITGGLYKLRRPENSDLEDACISVVANNNGQIQESIVVVNVYVPDVKVGQYFEEESERLPVICKICEEILSSYHGDSFVFWLESQRVLPVNGKFEHVISNRLLYKQNNETV